MRLPRLRTLDCDDLHQLQHIQYVYFKECFGSSVQVVAPATEGCIK